MISTSKESMTSQLWKAQWTISKFIITWSNINGLLIMKKKDDQVLLILYEFFLWKQLDEGNDMLSTFLYTR
jgi:hypothetical protein